MEYYTYDSFNRLNTAYINGVNSYYTYNGDNLRQTKTVDGETTKHVYDGMNVVADIVESTNVYLRSGSELVKNTNITENTSGIYYTEHKGDVFKRLKSDETFTEYKYDPFGEITNGALLTDSPFTYCGEYTDDETELVYLRNRYYDPSIGRFISEDPAKDGLNWYAYCENDPINCIDPSGNNWFKDFCSDFADSYNISEEAKSKASDEAQKNIQRDIWRTGAQKYLREQKGYLTSAWMLEHSLDDNPSDIWRGNDSRIAYLINHDDNFSAKVNEAILNSNGKTVPFQKK